MCRLLSKQYNLNADLETGMILSHDFSALTELGIGSYKEASLIQRAQIRDQKVAAIMLEAGIIFHSFFIGLDIGANTKNSAVRSLMIAMIVQQVELLLFLLILQRSYVAFTHCLYSIAVFHKLALIRDLHLCKQAMSN